MCDSVWIVTVESEHIEGQDPDTRVDLHMESFEEYRSNSEFVPCQESEPHHYTVDLVREVKLEGNGLALIGRLRVEAVDDDLQELIEAAFQLGRQFERAAGNGGIPIPRLRYQHIIGRKR